MRRLQVGQPVKDTRKLERIVGRAGRSEIRDDVGAKAWAKDEHGVVAPGQHVIAGAAF